MSGGHSHGHAGHGHGPGAHRGTDRRALATAAALTTGFTAAEVVGGLLTGSLALLADAAHMLSDSVSLLLALGAVWLAGRPATARRTFGYNRAEILAALANGVLLVVMSAWIVIEAIGRFGDPHEVLGGPMLAVAVVGLLVNLAAAHVLSRGGSASLNVAAALRHVLADLLGSVGVIVAAIVILATGWEAADPLISIVIAALVAASAWSVLRDALDVLLEAAPRDLDTTEIGRAMASLPGVVEVHDLHVWTITSGFPALSAHVIVERDADCHGVRRELERLLHDRFGLHHTTLQVDHHHDREALLEIELPEPPGRASAPPA
jgi:cobalt-zinc-cadmium efflux system protein